ncbi:hypothetical protein KEM52_002346 [Ascosphaera acerosa]|nr:hypothetical protein KEM52_002346 [Ascosphaera acerosa]
MQLLAAMPSGDASSIWLMKLGCLRHPLGVGATRVPTATPRYSTGPLSVFVPVFACSYRHWHASTQPARAQQSGPWRWRWRRRFATTSHVSRQQGDDGDERRADPGVTVNFYEQTTKTSKDRRPVDFYSPAQAEQQDVVAQIRRLRRELDIVKLGPFAPNSPLMRSLPEDERRLIEDIVKRYELEHPQSSPDDTDQLNAAMDEFVEDSRRVIEQAEVDVWKPTRRETQGRGQAPGRSDERSKADIDHDDSAIAVVVRDEHKALVSQLNKALEALRKESVPATRREALRLYRRCREAITDFRRSLPDQAFDLLWQSQMHHGDSDKRLAHGQLLFRDSLYAGRELTQSQWLDYMHLLADDGQVEAALLHWRDRQDSIDETRPEEGTRYWTTGIGLLIAHGDLAEARAIALKLLSSTKRVDPRIITPLIIAYAKSDGPHAKEWTWLLYLRLRQMLGTDITMGDYDALTIPLLQAGRTELALLIFKDMMVTHQRSKDDSVARFTASKLPWKKLDRVCASDLNAVALQALTVLPKSLANKFFFASWIKKLIGMGELDSAAKVVELMIERHIRPDAKHVNGLIGAWLRTPSTRNRAKAESLAWSMIEERTRRVQERHGAPESAELAGVKHYVDADNPLPPHLRRQVPQANIETFCVLLLHYARRSQEGMVNDVIKALRAASLTPNTFFMNHLLYAELRKDDPDSLWLRFREMTKNLRPDLETFDCLWRCAKLVHDHRRNTMCKEFPSIRQLYSMMMHWYAGLSDFQKARARADFSQDLYDEVLRCFSFATDAHGVVVALYSLKHIFGFVPTEADAQIIVSLLARLVQKAQSPHTRRRSRFLTRGSQNISKVTQVLEVVKNQRLAALGQEDLSFDDLTPEEQQQLQVDIMTDATRIFLNRIDGQADLTEAKLRQAAQEMGVPQVDLGGR